MNNSSLSEQKSITPARGYVEGYYGKLLSWSERSDLVRCLSSLQLNTYCYAPKEDTHHRLHWREPYHPGWRQSFAQFCTLAQDHNVSVVAGIAPGLDFNHKDSAADFKHLHSKAKQLLADGAGDILILWDDIEAGDVTGSLSEGTAHAHVVNELAQKLNQPLWTVPRVYAAEIENNNRYLEDFFAELQPQHTVLLCGNAIVASQVCTADLIKLSRSHTNSDNTRLKHRTIVWDNFYANDYCPRKLFCGPWTGREEINEYLINPTGMPYTDRLLLDIASSTHTSRDPHAAWAGALQRHGVPDSFQSIAPAFQNPLFGDRSITGNNQDIDNVIEPAATIEHAIEECLWKWKSPLAREWYPFIFGLKHDLAISQNTLPRERVLKTQTANLAKTLL